MTKHINIVSYHKFRHRTFRDIQLMDMSKYYIDKLRDCFEIGENDHWQLWGKGYVKYSIPDVFCYYQLVTVCQLHSSTDHHVTVQHRKR